MRKLLFQFVYLPLVRIQIFLVRKQNKKITKSIRLVIRCLFTRSRNILRLDRPGVDPIQDQKILLAINKLTKVEDPGTQEEFSIDERDVENWIAQLKQDSAISILLDEYFDLQLAISNNFDGLKAKILNKEKPEQNLSKRIGNKNLKEKNKIYRETLRLEQFELIDRTTKKFDFSLQDIASFFALTGSIIFLGAYLYNKLYFQIFNIKVDYFFNIVDYIQTGVSKIEQTLLQLAVFLVLAISGPNSFLYEENHDGPRSKNGIRIYYASLILIIVSGLYRFSINNEIPFFSLRIFGILVIFRVVFFLSTRFFKRKAKTFTLLLASTFFIFNMIVNAFQDAQNIKSRPNDESISIIFKNSSEPVLYQPIITIGVNTNYIFLSDTSFTETIAIERSEVYALKFKEE